MRLNLGGIKLFGQLLLLEGLSLSDDGKRLYYHKLNDGVFLKLGGGEDLKIYHDASNSYIDQTGTGDLILRTSSSGDDVFIRAMDDVFIQPKNGEAGVYVYSNGAVELYYDGSKKLETTNTGISVTGVSEFADNTAAIAGGLTTGDVYRTGDLLKIVH